MLHVVGYPAAAEALASAPFEGEVLAWNDPLHEGPVPGDLADYDLAELRARALEQLGFGDEREWRESWWDRNRRFEGALERHREWVLWFEPVLTDQLQQLDLLRRVARSRIAPILWVVPAPEGLAEFSSTELVSLFAKAEREPENLAWAERVWGAWTRDDPREMVARAEDPEVPLRVRSILDRWLEEFPDPEDGLTRMERELLGLLRQGPLPQAELFEQYQGRDPLHPVGDAVLAARLEELSQAASPLVEKRENATWGLSELGFAVLAGRRNRLELTGIDRWLGGVRLVSPDRVWTWDRKRRSFKLWEAIEPGRKL